MQCTIKMIVSLPLNRLLISKIYINNILKYNSVYQIMTEVVLAEKGSKEDIAKALHPLVKEWFL